MDKNRTNFGARFESRAGEQGAWREISHQSTILRNVASRNARPRRLGNKPVKRPGLQCCDRARWRAQPRTYIHGYYVNMHT